MDIKIKRFITPASFALWAVACFCFFQYGFKYHFYYLEQNQLFLFSGAYLNEFFRAPAWLSRMIGECLQQFYHYICVGPAILTLTLLVLGMASYKAFQKALPPLKENEPRRISALLISLVIITLEARLFVYENAQLASVLSLVGGACIWLLIDLARGRKQLVFILLSIAGYLLCYWLFGYGMLAMLLLELLRCLLAKKVPFAAIASIVVSIALAYPVSRHYRLEPKDEVMYPGAGKWIKIEPAKKVESILKYFNLYSRGEYKWIVELYESSKEEKRQEETLVYSLALSQFEMLPDRFLLMKTPMIGTSVHLGGGSSMIVSSLMSELYYLIGDMTYAERGFMHVNNFTLHKRSALAIQRLAQTELVTGDYIAADKYLRMLMKSPVYRRWAIEHTPQTMSPEVKESIEAKRPFVNTESEVRVGDNCRTMILGLLSSNKGNVVALDYLLCTDMIENRMDDFVKDYAAYGPRDKRLYEIMLKRANSGRQ